MKIESCDALLKENKRRLCDIGRKFNPITGEGSILERRRVEIEDFPLKVQYLPLEMLKNKFVAKIVRCGSIRRYIEEELGMEYADDIAHAVIKQFCRVRYRYDFAFWAATLAHIKRKGGGGDILFRLNRPQRRLISRYEKDRIAGRPIRIILLKARQWGGSTATQIYIAWLQLVHKVGLNSLIIAHVKDTSVEIMDMFAKLINDYPLELLYGAGEKYNPRAPKMENVGQSGNIKRIIARNCKIKIGTAEKPESCRGGDYNCVHLSEVGLWKKTDGKSPEDIVDSATSGILLKPYTMIVYESTAKGTGNFFHREYKAALKGESQFKPFFIAWFDIDQYSVDMSEEEEREFAEWLFENRNNENAMSDREESGKYLWWLFEKGATLQAIRWYIEERRKYNDHGHMASEYPSDEEEAFVHSGARVFDKYKVNEIEKTCRAPLKVGDVYGDADEGKDAIKNIRFTADKQGMLWIWSEPEQYSETERVANRYLTVVDVGGRSNKADWSVICVFDRLPMLDGDRPIVVAQWYGHIDIDRLAWKAAQVAAYYDNSLLVIESNTLETHDKERQIEGGDQSLYILNQIKDIYPNLYARKQSEDDIREGKPRKYGFHTNVATKPMIISNLIKVVREHLYNERDARCCYEYLEYERKQNGAYGAIAGKHDDLLMTRAIGLHICFNEMDMPEVVKKGQYIIRRDKPMVSVATI